MAKRVRFTSTEYSVISDQITRTAFRSSNKNSKISKLVFRHAPTSKQWSSFGKSEEVNLKPTLSQHQTTTEHKPKYVKYLKNKKPPTSFTVQVTELVYKQQSKEYLEG